MESNFGKVIRFLKYLPALFLSIDKKNFFYFLWNCVVGLPSMIKTRNLAYPSSRMWGRECVFRIFGKKIVIDGAWFGYANEIYVRKVYFSPPDFRIKRNDIVIDLGASGGIFSILAALLGKRVIAVESDAENFQELKLNAALNNCENKIEAIFGAVGANSGWITRERKRGCPSVSLSRIIRERFIEKVDFLKIDIEGSKFDLFRNDNGFLSKTKRIAMEVHPPFGDVKELVGILKKNNFKVTLLDVNQRTVPTIEGKGGGYLFATNNGTL